MTTGDQQPECCFCSGDAASATSEQSPGGGTIVDISETCAESDAGIFAGRRAHVSCLLAQMDRDDIPNTPEDLTRRCEQEDQDEAEAEAMAELLRRIACGDDEPDNTVDPIG